MSPTSYRRLWRIYCAAEPDHGCLVFAPSLEHIEDGFYRSGLPGLIAEEFVGYCSAAIELPKLDLTAGDKYADALTNFEAYLTLSQTFEDLGVAACQGQAGVLAPTTIFGPPDRPWLDQTGPRAARYSAGSGSEFAASSSRSNLVSSSALGLLNLASSK